MRRGRGRRAEENPERKDKRSGGKKWENETDSALRRRKKMRKSVHRSNAIICFVCTCWRMNLMGKYEEALGKPVFTFNIAEAANIYR